MPPIIHCAKWKCIRLAPFFHNSKSTKLNRKNCKTMRLAPFFHNATAERNIPSETSAECTGIDGGCLRAFVWQCGPGVKQKQTIPGGRPFISSLLMLKPVYICAHPLLFCAGKKMHMQEKRVDLKVFRHPPPTAKAWRRFFITMKKGGLGLQSQDLWKIDFGAPKSSYEISEGSGRG